MFLFCNEDRKKKERLNSLLLWNGRFPGKICAVGGVK